MSKRKSCFFVVTVIFCLSGQYVQSVQAARFKVMVVMSYEKTYPWVKEIREGIESLLANSCHIKYFYLNTKTAWRNGPKRAKAAYELYKTFKPDGVIAADDDAQSMFVVPYLKDTAQTPVIFCGVNAEPDKYGYPASNVTGVLEREPMKESLLLLSQLVPAVKRFCFISKDSPTAKAVEKQLEDEKDTYPIKFIGTRTANTMHQALIKVRELRQMCDALLYITMEGLYDKHGKPLSDKEIMPVLIEAFGKPVITNASYRVKYGALSAVVKSGQEHGRLAAEKLLKAMRGTPVREIPITQNRYGRRIINVDTMRTLNIKPSPSLIRSAYLVRTEK
jgi:ABC-type uncharacterized transport system substrate-binding protein